jgi:hypothetical protein
METIIDFNFTWTDFILTSFLLLGLYFLLQFFRRFLKGPRVLGRYQDLLAQVVKVILLVYEPLASLILLATLFLINPVFFGLILSVLFLAGFVHFKNYIIGRIILLDSPLAVGKKLKSNSVKGIITRIGRLGLHLNMVNGLHFISYQKLQSDGFTLLSGEEIGGFYQLNISPINPEHKGNYKQKIIDRLITTPYLDRNHKLEFAFQNQEEKMQLKVLIREQHHLHDLIALISEWGYNCEISKK